MTIKEIYDEILKEVSANFSEIKDSIINAWEYKKFKVKINLTYDSITDEHRNNALGGFYSCENEIKISYTELIEFVGNKICNDNLSKIGGDMCKKIFYYYTLYVLAHEIHHAYLYNVLPEEYKKIKEEDKGKDYKDLKLEKCADDHAIKYLNEYNSTAKFVGELAIKLREGKYMELKVSGETDEECKKRFIVEEIEKLIKN